jgi:hypothetical protein
MASRSAFERVWQPWVHLLSVAGCSISLPVRDRLCAALFISAMHPPTDHRDERSRVAARLVVVGPAMINGS